ncbi:MAG: DUF3168 domain-containing protein [Alphaproteobacteria bacterium]|nr:DUF3168 domain-containing protein [Alphaproteobacteria bacterium]
MGIESSLEVRKAVIPRLRASSSLTALVPAERIYPPRTPAEPDWPFIRYGQPDTAPFRATGIDGAEIDFSVHTFSKAPGEDEASRINAAVVATLDGAVLDLPGGFKAHITWTGGQVIPDGGDPDAWHAFSTFRARVVTF